MQESSVYEHFVETAGEEYYQRGARQTAIQSVFSVKETIEPHSCYKVIDFNITKEKETIQ